MGPKRIHKGGRGKRDAQDEVIALKKSGVGDPCIRAILVKRGYSKARVSQLMKAAGCKPGPYSKWENTSAQNYIFRHDADFVPDANVPDANVD